MLVGGVLGEAVDCKCQLSDHRPLLSGSCRRCRSTGEAHIRRRTSSLQKGRLADIALDIHGLLVDFELRLGHLDVLVFAVALRCCLGSLLTSSAF